MAPDTGYLRGCGTILRRRWGLLVPAVVLAVLSLSAAGTAGTTRGAWGPPRLLGPKAPGTEITALSCASAGSCSAGGDYGRAFVESEAGGSWQARERLPRLGGARSISGVEAIACGAPGSCSVAGDYQHSAAYGSFFASQSGGSWQTPRKLDAIAGPKFPPDLTITSMSCGSVGSCTAGGDLRTSASDDAVVVSESAGSWQKPEPVPGIASLGTGRDRSSQIESISCTSAGNCAAAGSYDFFVGNREESFPFVASETGGTWQHAERLLGTGFLGTFIGLSSVSCTSADSCTAVGSYLTSHGRTESFVAGSRGGIWGRAARLRGTGALGHKRSVKVQSVSCGSPGNCAAGGTYTLVPRKRIAPFVISEVAGRWQRAKPIAGSFHASETELVQSTWVSCASAHNCAAGGVSRPGFVVSDINGTWQPPVKVPGKIYAVSCAPAGKCTAAGTSSDRSQALVISQSAG